MKKLPVLIFLIAFCFFAKGQKTETRQEQPFQGVPTLTITDSRDGNEYAYRTYSRDIGFGVVISQTWMLENMRYQTKRGSVYHERVYSEEEQKRYGRLYTKEAAAEACPSGWHLPTDIEWQRLMHLVNPGGLTYDSGDELAFNRLTDSGVNGVNITFSGYGFEEGIFYALQGTGSYWSQYENRLGLLVFGKLKKEILRIFALDGADMFSCRCIKD